MSHSEQPGNLDSNKVDMAEVAHAYRDARENDGMLPPPALDDAIRAAARRAVHAGPRPAGGNWLRKWTPQLAVAAVVVLSVSVLFVSVEERPDLAPQPLQKLALKRQPEVAPEAPPPAQVRAVDTVSTPNVAADSGKKKAALETDRSAASAEVAGTNLAALAKEERSTTTTAKATVVAAASPAPAPPVHAPPAPPSPAIVAPAPVSTPVPSSVVLADAIAPARKEARTDAAQVAASESRVLEEKTVTAGAARARESFNAPAKTTAPAATAVPTSPTPLAAPPAAAALGAKQAAAPIRDALRSNSAPVEAQATGSVGIRSLVPEAFPAADKADANQRPGPWLRRLLELREQGKLKELREELVRFRKAHPDVVLPKSLTELP